MPPIRSVYRFSAGVEILTGIGIVAVPSLIMEALFNTALAHPLIAIARLYGLALVGLGLACWERNNQIDPAFNAKIGICLYNITAGLLLFNYGLKSVAPGQVLIIGGGFHFILGMILLTDLGKLKFRS